ncbi:MAG: DsrE/DsrF/DrsH-like family protein [Thermodesulfobacteriota bacterium]|jgi:peroxiredoxin family protein
MAEVLATKVEEINKGGMTVDSLAKQVADLRRQIENIKPGAENRVSLIVFSGDLDKVLAAFVIATGAVAMGMEAVMFFTFWGTPVLRDPSKKAAGKDFMGKMFGFMLPKGRNAIKLSKMNMAGMGTSMMKSLMKKKNVASLDQMVDMAAELGVKIYICEMSMSLMGFKQGEFIDYPNLEYVGVATFLEQAKDSKVQLFI